MGSWRAIYDRFSYCTRWRQTCNNFHWYSIIDVTTPWIFAQAFNHPNGPRHVLPTSCNKIKILALTAYIFGKSGFDDLIGFAKVTVKNCYIVFGQQYWCVWTGVLPIRNREFHNDVRIASFNSKISYNSKISERNSNEPRPHYLKFFPTPILIVIIRPLTYVQLS